MKTEYEFLSKGEEVFLLTGEAKTVSLKEAIGTLAMSTYADLLNLKNIKDESERKGLKEKINFQSKVLDSLSSAYSSIRN